MADASSWNKNLPDGSTYVRNADDIIRSNQSVLEAVVGAEHLFSSEETRYAGTHVEGSARAYVRTAATLPAPVADVAEGRMVLTSDTKAIYGYLSATSTPTKLFDPGDYYTRAQSDASFQPAGSYATSGHTHAIGALPVAGSGVTSTTALVRADDVRLNNARAPTTHTHDDRYFTESEINTKLASYSTTGHNHDGRYYTEAQSDARFQPIGSYAAAPLSGSKAIASTAVPVDSTATVDIPVAGAAQGDVVAVGLEVNNSLLAVTAYVNTAGNVRVSFRNTDTAVSATLNAQTIKVKVFA